MSGGVAHYDRLAADLVKVADEYRGDDPQAELIRTVFLCVAEYVSETRGSGTVDAMAVLAADRAAAEAGLGGLKMLAARLGGEVA